MNSSTTVEQVRAHLLALTRDTGGRPVGSAANHAAEAYIAGVLAKAGFEVERQLFECVDWQLLGTELWVGDGPLPARANPFSPACNVTAPIVFAGNMAELERADLSGRIAVLHGELTATPLFPRNYPFFTVEDHQRIIDRLENGRPQAVITVSPMRESPAPIIEDGDFGVPSITVAADVGTVLGDAAGPVTVRVRSVSRPGHGANVIGRRSRPARDKLVLCAHFDTKPGTPGALDNAAGVAAVLALAERLSAADTGPNLEVVAFNGEDHYAAPGEIAYVNGCGSEFGRINLLINIDGIGLKDSPTTLAFFNLPDERTAKIRAAMSTWGGLEESPPWPEGDHSIFAMQGVPCLAVTSGGIHTLLDGVIHTPGDTAELVDAERIASAVDFLATIR